MVTLLGFLFIIANVGLVLVYVPDLVGPVGRLCFFASVGRGYGRDQG